MGSNEAMAFSRVAASLVLTVGYATEATNIPLRENLSLAPALGGMGTGNACSLVPTSTSYHAT